MSLLSSSTDTACFIDALPDYADDSVNTYDPQNAAVHYHNQIAARQRIPIGIKVDISDDDDDNDSDSGNNTIKGYTIKVYPTKVVQFLNLGEPYHSNSFVDHIYTHNIFQDMAGLIINPTIWPVQTAITFIPCNGQELFDNYIILRIDETAFEFHGGQFSLTPQNHNNTKLEVKLSQVCRDRIGVELGDHCGNYFKFDTHGKCCRVYNRDNKTFFTRQTFIDDLTRFKTSLDNNNNNTATTPQ